MSGGDDAGLEQDDGNVAVPKDGLVFRVEDVRVEGVHIVGHRRAGTAVGTFEEFGHAGDLRRPAGLLHIAVRALIDKRERIAGGEEYGRFVASGGVECGGAELADESFVRVVILPVPNLHHAVHGELGEFAFDVGARRGNEIGEDVRGITLRGVVVCIDGSDVAVRATGVVKIAAARQGTDGIVILRPLIDLRGGGVGINLGMPASLQPRNVRIVGMEHEGHHAVGGEHLARTLH